MKIDRRTIEKVKIPLGTKIGSVTCISSSFKNPTSKKKYPALYIRVRCDCGEEFDMTKHQFNDNKRSKKKCKKCGRKDSANKHKNGYGQVSGSYISSVRAGASRRGIGFSIDAEYAWDVFNAQGGECALTGIKLIMTYDGKRNATNTASIDRIDSSKGYIEGNIQWVHKDINAMKLGMSDTDFISYCKLVIEYNKKKAGN